ncbi:MAG: ImmA/IrrE family metallo-endopeptidase [Candidatus Devosia phytovorans]|uniref:ImmA/IrrE family metallo-endopeptidase n=1 Tax=Candidatus Devosia phytovorans TaxID=3121372 RepID=A0AAJ5VVA8_9HYPH|nr:ImmA/IrrE family metallo-endopeptidase [Devosia sp.]WEK04054.1 MAG: ImmA/IrrE family metallo-endopeptidase [Devosia sp.]
MARYGFKAWAERIASEKRTALALQGWSPLSARALADHLNVRVWYPKEIPNISLSVLASVERIEPGAWSAATIVYDGKHLVILNSRHPPGRQSNDLMHELAHIICGHEPSQTQPLADGTMMVTDYDSAQEEEADILGATLLLPRVALIAIMEASLTIAEAAAKYGVSEELVKMRLQRAGVFQQFSRRGRPQSA